MSGNGTSTINALLKKTEHYDKDERYMATSDLCEILKRHAAAAAAASSGGTGANASGDVASSSMNVHAETMIDASTERRICTAVLKLLDDSSNDVQTIAVKTLGVLLTTVHIEQAKEIANRLRTLVLAAEKADLRDVYAIGLRTLVKTIPLAMGDAISQCLVGPLLDGIRANSTTTGVSTDRSKDNRAAGEITLACLDVLTDVLSRFGSSSIHVVRQHEQILTIAFAELASEKEVVRKRASNTLGQLSVVLSDALLFRLIESLLSQIGMAVVVTKKKGVVMGNSQPVLTGATSTADTRALIRTMCKVSGAVGHRLGQEFIDRIIPIFLRFCDAQDAYVDEDEEEEQEDDDEQDEEQEQDDEAATALANELRESCFAGFESFILTCPTKVKPHLDQIVQSALAYMSYDPNYSYGDDEEYENEGGEDGMDYENEEEDDEDEEYFDDEDEYLDDEDDDDSWKVRRSAIRALAAVVVSSKQDPSPLWTVRYEIRKNKKKASFAGALVSRFKEREENCRVDVIDCFTKLLEFSIHAASSGVIVLASGDQDIAMKDESEVSAENAIDFASTYTPTIVKACEKQLEAKKGGERSKSSALALLSKLSTAPGGLGGAPQIKSVFTHLRPILGTSDFGQIHHHHHHDSSGSKALKLDALALVRTVLSRNENDPTTVKDSLLGSIMKELCQSVDEDWYKVIAAALGVLAEVPRVVLRGGASDDEKRKVASMLYHAIEPRLAAHDVDQEIKEFALAAAAALLSSLHTHLSAEQQGRLLSLTLERLRNDTTRQASIKALTIVSSGVEGSSKIDLSNLLADMVTELASLLRQQSRGLKQSALVALDVVIKNHGKNDADIASRFDKVLQELSTLISDTDLHVCHLSLSVTTSILRACPSCGGSVTSHVLPASIALAKSSLLQNPALDSLLGLLEQVVVSESMEFKDIMQMLQRNIDEHPSGKKHSLGNIAKCMAVVTAATSSANRDTVLAGILSKLEGTDDDGGDMEKKQLAMLLSGDIGRRVNLGSTPSVAAKLKEIYLASFSSSSEDIKHATAYALGCAASGATSVFLPTILDALERGNDQKKYLVLSSLRELIHCHQADGKGELALSIDVIMPHLMNHCADADEGVRTMIAECLGSLSCLKPSVVLPQLEGLAIEHSQKGEESDNLVCATIATSVKLAIASRADPAEMAPFMPSFLRLLQEKDLGVRNASLLVVYSAVHHAPQLVSGLMQEHILPSLYELSQLNHKRVVDLGPFKHTVDDALPLRKACLSIFTSALEKCPGSLDIPAFMPLLVKACEDVEDVQLQAHQIVISMCHRHPAHVLDSLDTFVGPLNKTLNRKIGQKTGTELERANEWTKSAIRVTVNLARLDGVRSHAKFAEFIDRMRGNTKFLSMLESIESER